ncbi:iron-sulfur cluster insertion protein ErpA [Teredinibacter sp. KSP-S5-2]|uniref:iron-sulfur cluster insertion protein ErpA n=1 Tax=Teredinibacter sp. KSP-S5-2 TaxID=3034506 RepID=UPI00293466C0|nr:iron-sulfur cluster insertion protein ErpA [Teredinibacter sp. KSP-S5-2]WNO09606.1 iron-sulfur cluster insertion protein ErpA [Teredinibacter sp. KSP-S5-2]
MSGEPQTFIPQPIEVTDNALNKVRSLIEEEDNPDLKLRVFVTGGGCSGFQYGFAFDEAVAEDDAEISREGVSVVVDAMSYPYLVGAKLDYEEGLQGSKFTVVNPNASSTCGCGSSFSI